MNVSTGARCLALALTTSLSLLVGCSIQVIGGVARGAGAAVGAGGMAPGNGGAVIGGGGDGGGGVSYDAVALTWAQLEAYYQGQIQGGSVASSSSSAGGGVDPSKVFLQVSNGGLTCADPQTDDDPCGGAPRWTISIGLAPELVVAGATYTLEALYAGYGLTASSLSPPDGVLVRGGSFHEGAVTINEVTGTSVAFTLSGTNANADFEGVLSDGDYVAPRCF